MNRFKSIFCVFLVLMTAAMLAGCKNEGLSSSAPESSESPESSQSSLAISPEPSAVEELTPEPTREPSKPSSKPESQPAPAGFEELFDANPIDAQLQYDLSIATNTNAILQAYDDNNWYWTVTINNTFQAVQELLSGEELSQLQQEQDQWSITVEEELNAIKEENGSGAEGIIGTAQMTGEKYRERAKALCQLYFDLTGKLPDFDLSMSDEPVG